MKQEIKIEVEDEEQWENFDSTSEQVMTETSFTPSSANTEQRKNNYIYQLLMETYEGEFQIAAYDYEQNLENYQKLLQTKKTTYFSKSKITKLIIQHEFRRAENHTISSSRFQELARLTAEVFPTCLAETFYSPTLNGRTACGSFQNVYTKIREKEYAIGRLKKNPVKRKLYEIVHSTSEVFQELENVTSCVDESYKTKWLNTAFDERIGFYKESSLETIFEKLPNLRNPNGKMLIEADFCKYFNKEPNTFVQKWSSLAEKVIAFAKTKRNDAEIKAILRENSPFKGEYHKQIVALIVLPYFWKRTVKVTSKVRGNWFPEKVETLKSFIFHKTNENVDCSLKEADDELQHLYVMHKRTVKPYVIIIGPSLSDIRASFVVAGNQVYQTETVMEAVELCFQVYSIFFEEFSCICNHVWHFIAKDIYDWNVAASATTLSIIENLRKKY